MPQLRASTGRHRWVAARIKACVVGNGLVPSVPADAEKEGATAAKAVHCCAAAAQHKGGAQPVRWVQVAARHMIGLCAKTRFRCSERAAVQGAGQGTRDVRCVRPTGTRMPSCRPLGSGGRRPWVHNTIMVRESPSGAMAAA